MGPRAILPYLILVAFLGKLIDRLTRPPEDTRAENLRRWASGVPGVTPIAEVEPRTRHRITGVIQNLRIDPREGHGWVEATIIDGTGEIVVRWLGRPSKAGIRLGVGLVAEGTIATKDRELQLLNPEYELIEGPESAQR
jgi:RecG-like helicase